MKTAMVLIGALAVFALLLNFQWLFFAMLILFVALALADSFSHSESPGHAHHSSPTKLTEKKTNPILDFVAGSLVADEVKKQTVHKKDEHKDGEKKEGGH